MSSAAAASESLVLKIISGDEVHRVPLKGVVDFAAVQEVLRAVWSGTGEPSAKYEDEEGDLCGLVDATFEDFLTTAKPSGSRQLLRLKLFPPAAKAAEAVPHDEEVGQEAEHYRLDAQDSQCASPRDSASSELDENEAIAMADQARLACQQMLVSHLQEWLASEPATVSFEAWIREVHPENCKCGAVDPRMYCEAGDHRHIWNAVAADAPGLTSEERESRFVAAKADSPAQSRAGPLEEVPADLQPSAPPPATEEAPTTQPTVADVEQAAASPADGGVAPAPAGEECGQPDARKEQLKKKATCHVAIHLPVFAATLRKRASRMDRAQQALPEELRPGFELLAEVLQLSGPSLEGVADAADDVISESVLFGTGVALLATRAAALPWQSRLVFVQLLCENCPQLLSPCVPAHVLAPFCASGSGSTAAWQAKEAAKEAYRQQRKAAKAAYRDAMETARATRRQSAEAHREAMKQLAESHARSCRQAAQAHKAACRAHADAHRAAVADARAQRLFAWLR